MSDTPRGLEPREYLDSLILHGVKLGLRNISALMDTCGNPHLTYPTVHVGGTNGKGSVLAFLGAILEAAGYRAGRFTSPHLLDVTERFLIDNRPMDEVAFSENITVLKHLSEKQGFTPTFFEMNTAMAFRWFARQEVDIALIEVGMGGRFDSTNIIQPLACAITNIDMDHTQYLGDTLVKIAFEKAGILKREVPAVIGESREEALSVIREQAAKLATPLYCLGHEYAFQPGGTVWRPVMDYHGLGAEWRGLNLGLAGEHQAHNAALAISLALLLAKKFERINERAIRQGLSRACWPGRLERVLEHPPVYMDAAHNPAGCRVLAKAFDRCVVVFSVSSDKEASAMIDILSSIADPLLLTTYQGERAMPVEMLRQQAGGHRFLSFARMSEALEAGMQMASTEKPLLIAGSIYGAGEARRILMDGYHAKPPSFSSCLTPCPVLVSG